MTFEEFCKENKIRKGSHDYSIARAAWNAAIQALISGLEEDK